MELVVFVQNYEITRGAGTVSVKVVGIFSRRIAAFWSVPHALLIKSRSFLFCKFEFYFFFLASFTFNLNIVLLFGLLSGGGLCLRVFVFLIYKFYDFFLWILLISFSVRRNFFIQITVWHMCKNFWRVYCFLVSINRPQRVLYENTNMMWNTLKMIFMIF